MYFRKYRSMMVIADAWTFCPRRQRWQSAPWRPASDTPTSGAVLAALILVYLPLRRLIGGDQFVRVDLEKPH